MQHEQNSMVKLMIELSRQCITEGIPDGSTPVMNVDMTVWCNREMYMCYSVSKPGKLFFRFDGRLPANFYPVCVYVSCPCHISQIACISLYLCQFNSDHYHFLFKLLGSKLITPSCLPLVSGPKGFF